MTRIADDPAAAARELAGEIAARSPDAIRRAKRLADEAPWLTRRRRAWRSRRSCSASCSAAPNQLAAVTAALTGQPAEFSDPA